MVKRAVTLSKIVLTMIMLFALLLAGCNRQQPWTLDFSAHDLSNKHSKVIGFSVAGFTVPYFRVLIEYARLEAIKHSVELIVLDAEWSDDLIDAFAGASMDEEAALAADSIIKLLGENGGNVVMLKGAEGNFATIHRALGFENAIKEYPNIKIIAREYTGWERAKAKSAMKKILSKHRRIDALYAQDDNIAIGAI